jgi:hypothetical protein
MGGVRSFTAAIGSLPSRQARGVEKMFTGKSKRTAFLIPLIALQIFSTCQAQYNDDSLEVYSARIGGGEVESTRTFDCSESIYVFVQANGPRDPRSTLEARWTNPEGEVVQSTERTFESLPGGGDYAWDGIDIQAGGNAISNTLGAMFDPAAGFEDAIGTWQVHVSVDGIPLQPVSLRVMC